MDDAWAIRRQVLKVLFGAVPFMGEKIIAGKLAVILGHEAIPRHFRHDRSRRDGQAQQIAFHDGADRDMTTGQGDGVNEEAVGLRPETGERSTHGQAGRFENVQPVDLLVARAADSDRNCSAGNRDVELFTFRFGEKFGIVTPDDPAAAGQNDGGRDDWTGQGASTRLIQAGNPAISAPAGFQFKFVRRTHEVDSACGHPLPRGR